jgi:ABC-type Mn2+/Zn2+ transport system permease subunit
MSSPMDGFWSIPTTRDVSDLAMETLITWLVEPLTYPFMLRGLLAALMIGLVVPVLGCYVVLRGMAFYGDALAHIILPGVVVAFLLGWPLALGALIVGVLAALAIGGISSSTTIREDSAIGVVFAGALALGVLLLSVQRSYAVDLAHILFGDLLGVSPADLGLMAGLSFVALVTVLLFYKEFLVLSFDRVLATTMQLPVRTLNNLLYVLLAVVVVISIQAVGIALVVAMLVTPASAAYLLTRRLARMMLLASAIGAASGVIGLYASFYLDVASGPAIVLVATAIFGLIFLFAPGRGYLSSRTQAAAV